MDYRDLAGERFDAIASIGMVEHVGAERIDLYAERLASLLPSGGRLLNHGIARLRHSDPDAGPFSERYVFPDADPLHLSRVLLALERAGFATEHVEGFALRLRRDAPPLGPPPRREPRPRDRPRRPRAGPRLAPLPACRPQRLRERLHVDLPGPDAAGLSRRPRPQPPPWARLATVCGAQVAHTGVPLTVGQIDDGMRRRSGPRAGGYFGRLLRLRQPSSVTTTRSSIRTPNSPGM